MKSILRLHILIIGLIITCAVHAADYTLVATFPEIKKDHIIVDGASYPIVDDRNANQYGFKTKCYTEDGHAITYYTIYAVGYVNKARIVISNGAVKEFHIQEIQM